jgi:hypothetical protein
MSKAQTVYAIIRIVGPSAEACGEGFKFSGGLACRAAGGFHTRCLISECGPGRFPVLRAGRHIFVTSSSIAPERNLKTKGLLQSRCVSSRPDPGCINDAALLDLSGASRPSRYRATTNIADGEPETSASRPGLSGFLRSTAKPLRGDLGSLLSPSVRALLRESHRPPLL